jgi:hypothetical protein
MNITRTLLVALSGLVLLSACSDSDTYADRVKKERKQISSFLKTGAAIRLSDSNDTLAYFQGDIKVISEEEFYAHDSTTNVSKNEYVLFSGSGVYMQIVRKGSGTKIKDNDNLTVLTRYVEYNIASDSLQTTNRVQAYAAAPDAMNVTKTNGLFSGRFTSGLMLSQYQSSSVPTAWLIPLSFVNVGRQDSPEGTALVRLIVPSSQGQSDASYNVYPCAYEISYERGR